MIEQTLVLMKPDAVMRGLTGRILSRFEDVGLKIVAAKMTLVDEDFGKKHYFDVAERHGEEVRDALVKYLAMGPVVAFVLEGVHAPALVRKMVGHTFPDQANPGTIRGDFCHISKEYANGNKRLLANVVHASANSEEAKYEIDLWFKKDEIHSYDVVHQHMTQ